MSIIEFSDVTMRYPQGMLQRRRSTPALADLTFEIEEGSFVVLMGPSGAGKSSLLKLILAMHRPDTGTIRVAGRDIQRLRRASIPYLRRNVGAIFQDFKLLSEASAHENVALALAALGGSKRHVRERAADILAQVELDPFHPRPVRCLSGGEQQRVAIARALACEPAILLADEPTGNLDPRLTQEILTLLSNVRDRGTTVVLATHDPLVRDHARVDQDLCLRAGRLLYDSAARRSPAPPTETPAPAESAPTPIGAVA